MDPLLPPEEDGTEVTAGITPIRPGQPSSPRGVGQSGRRRSKPVTAASGLTVLFALAAGVAAARAGGAPTEIHPLDLAIKFLLAAACVYAGRVTPWPFVGLAACGAAACSYRSPAALVAVAVLGLALYGWRAAAEDRRLLAASAPSPEPEPGDPIPLPLETSSSASGGTGRGRRRRLTGPPRSNPLRYSVLRAAGCGALACVGLRASWPAVTLGPSLLAGAIVLLILVPGVLAAPRRLRTVVLRVTGVAALAVIVLLAIAGGAAYEAQSPLRSALDAARSGLSAAEHGDQAAAVADFERSRASFQRAHGDLSWARAGEVVPVLSQQVRAVLTAAEVGGSLAQAGVETASTASVRNLTLVDGAFPVARLAALQPVFRRDLDVLHTVTGEATGSFSSPWIIAPLRSKLDLVSSRLQRATHDARIGLLATEEVPAILGADGTETYLVLVENPAESRASGGVVGDYAEITADNGRLHLVKVGGVDSLDYAGVPFKERTLPPIPDFVDRYGAYYPQDHWENITMSPDFPTVAEVAEYLYPQSGGVRVNGVISVDPVAVAGMLKLVGPVKVRGLDQFITDSNVVSFLAHQEFLDFDNNKLRVTYVESLLRKVWHELVSRPLPNVTRVVRDFQPAVRGGHLFIYSSSAGEESFFRDVGVAGAMPKVEGDFVGVVTQNNGGNKIDWYLRRAISYHATVNLQWHTISATLTVTLENLAPSSGQPPIVIDGAPGADTAPGENLTWFNVYTPWQLDGTATLNGKPLTLNSQYELGRQVYSAVIGVPSSGTDVVTLHLVGTWPRSLSHYELGWFQQPLLFKDLVSRSVTVIG